MMKKNAATKSIAALLGTLLLTLLSSAAIANVTNFRFGIFRAEGGKYVMDVETKRIPQNLGDTGFRFGVTFDNPDGYSIEWYDLLKLPATVQQIGGDLSAIDATTLKGEPQKTTEKNLMMKYWFDEGDPLGRYQIEIFVNGVRKYQGTFDVVTPEK